MNNEQIFKYIKESFCELWLSRSRGETLELITPISTVNQKFVSIFITRRNGKYVIADGGWLASGEYDTVFKKAILEEPIITYYATQYDIKNTYGNNGLPVFFKVVDVFETVPGAVYDLSLFLSGVINSNSFLHDNETDDIKERRLFNGKANDYLRTYFGDRFLINKAVSEDDFKHIKFNAIFPLDGKMTLIKYITGSTPGYISNSISKAATDFQIINGSKYQRVIENRLAIVDDTSFGFQGFEQYQDYKSVLVNHTAIEPILWSNKEEILQFLPPANAN